MDIYTMKSDGSDLVQVTDSPTEDEFPDWGDARVGAVAARAC
jgi:hypothetical protein